MNNYIFELNNYNHLTNIIISQKFSKNNNIEQKINWHTLILKIDQRNIFIGKIVEKYAKNFKNKKVKKIRLNELILDIIEIKNYQKKVIFTVSKTQEQKEEKLKKWLNDGKISLDIIFRKYRVSKDFMDNHLVDNYYGKIKEESLSSISSELILKNINNKSTKLKYFIEQFLIKINMNDKVLETAIEICEKNKKDNILFLIIKYQNLSHSNIEKIFKIIEKNMTIKNIYVNFYLKTLYFSQLLTYQQKQQIKDIYIKNEWLYKNNEQCTKMKEKVLK